MAPLNLSVFCSTLQSGRRSFRVRIATCHAPSVGTRPLWNRYPAVLSSVEKLRPFCRARCAVRGAWRAGGWLIFPSLLRRRLLISCFLFRSRLLTLRWRCCGGVFALWVDINRRPACQRLGDRFHWGYGEFPELHVHGSWSSRRIPSWRCIARRRARLLPPGREVR